MDLEDDIPQNHLVRVVNAAFNRLDVGWHSLAHNLLKWATVKEKEQVLVEI